jgi:hypothetical protein
MGPTRIPSKPARESHLGNRQPALRQAECQRRRLLQHGDPGTGPVPPGPGRRLTVSVSHLQVAWVQVTASECHCRRRSRPEPARLPGCRPTAGPGHAIFPSPCQADGDGCLGYRDIAGAAVTVTVRHSHVTVTRRHGTGMTRTDSEAALVTVVGRAPAHTGILVVGARAGGWQCR